MGEKLGEIVRVITAIITGAAFYYLFTSSPPTFILEAMGVTGDINTVGVVVSAVIAILVYAYLKALAK